MQMLTVAIIAPGNMGAAVGARLAHNGVRVVTSLAGRGAASGQRASAAGMSALEDAELVAAHFVLSILPPKEALGLAERLAPALRAAAVKPLYVDCNAVSPETVTRVGDVIAAAGCRFVDAGIIGGPPHKTDGPGPRFYVSGSNAGELLAFKGHGLDIRVMDGAIGDASALKMVYGGLNKGMIALGAAMILAAERAGVGDAFHAELEASQRNLLGSLSRGVPDMFQKAYRWVAEMEEVADFTQKPAEGAMFEGIGALFQRLADDADGSRREIDALAGFFDREHRSSNLIGQK